MRFYTNRLGAVAATAVLVASTPERLNEFPKNLPFLTKPPRNRNPTRQRGNKPEFLADASGYE